MEKYHRILVPYDGSKFSERALREAIKVAKKFDSDLFLLTVVDASSVSMSKTKNGTMLDVKKFARSLKNHTAKLDLRLRDEVLHCKEQGVSADYELVTGKPAEIILKFAKKREIDLIAMGIQGLTGLGRLKALGSISRRISEQASCPVLLVH